jgi:hypothetical protein
MQINSTRNFTAPAAAKAAPAPAKKESASKQPGDQVQIDWSGSRPAHRNIKKLTRGIAAGVGVAGLGATAYAALSGGGLMAAGIGLAATALAVTAVDIGSGLAHHAGDNYLNPNLPHTQWHTEPTNADYCMVGFSNKALDSVEFWPKLEKAVYKTTGKEPISWQVSEYKAYCLGEIDADTLRQSQIDSGMIKS